jgi:prevent-host-death family protein
MTKTIKRTWALQDAKNRLSEVVDRAISEGPQTITRRGVETVVVVSVEEFRDLAEPKGSLVNFFRASPLARANLNLGSESQDLDADVSS